MQVFAPHPPCPGQVGANRRARLADRRLHRGRKGKGDEESQDTSSPSSRRRSISSASCAE
jgi:hypothetical protein